MFCILIQQAALFIVSLFIASCQFPHCLAWRSLSRGRAWMVPAKWQPQPASSGCFRPSHFLGVMYKRREQFASDWHSRPLHERPERDTARSSEVTPHPHGPRRRAALCGDRDPLTATVSSSRLLGLKCHLPFPVTLDPCGHQAPGGTQTGRSGPCMGIPADWRLVCS